MAHSKYGIHLSQMKYELDIIGNSSFLAFQPTTSPMEQNLHLNSTDVVLLPNPSMY